jgi:hypothetical protein
MTKPPVRPTAPRAAMWAMPAVPWLGPLAPVSVTLAAPLARIRGQMSRPARSLAPDGRE